MVKEIRKTKNVFTSESVTEGHPDKICDQISDAILDEILSQDPKARVACETSVTTGLVLISGEVRTTAKVDYQQVARDTINKIGYNRAKFGFDAETCAVLVTLHTQSADIAQGVDASTETKNSLGQDPYDLIGAGDQGLMFGYATNETAEYMPIPITLAHKLTKQLADVRKSGKLSYLRPDGKAQVTVEYNEDNTVKRIDTVVVSTQHAEDVDDKQLHNDVKREVIEKVLPTELLDSETKIHINPTGRFIIGGPHGDAGLTGRKIIVDTYGGTARHGGGAFSGKDATKVDRSAAYAARYVAKNIVAAGLADKCEIQVAYAIGVANPVSIIANTFGTGKISDLEITDIVYRHFDLRPAAIIDQLELHKPMYRQVAAYGHFGRPELALPWEKLDKVEELKDYLK